jgi:hypothetical protein
MLVQCPEQFRLRRVLKIPESMGVDRFVGIVDHGTHAENFRQKIATDQDLQQQTMWEIFDNTWDQTILQEGEPEWSSPVEQTKTLGQLMVDTYHAQVSPTVHPIKVEERFEQTFKNMPIPIVGYPDVETRSQIIERKTSASKLSKPKSKWVVQGRIYSMVYAKPVEYHIITKQKTPQVVTAETAPAMCLHPEHADSTLQVIEQALFSLNDYWTRYGPDHPWPTTGLYHDWLCNYCFAGPSYGGFCVAWKGQTNEQDRKHEV